jgi:hypothetical protein
MCLKRCGAGIACTSTSARPVRRPHQRREQLLARFLGLYTAMEAYCRARHGQNNFRRLREYAEVPDRVHGCSNHALALIGQTRKYLAHLSHDGKFSDNEITNNVFASTRRASALMQCCLLRELGFGHKQVERVVNSHYSNWPIPIL